MNLKKISITIITVLVLLYGLTYLSTTHKSTAMGFNIFGYTVKYPTTEAFLSATHAPKKVTQKVDSIVHNIESMVTAAEDNADAVIAEEPSKKDTLQVKKEKKKVLPDFSKIDVSKVQRIAYPEHKEAFITKLKSQLASNQCRIIHYGDSQLEGDRISAYVRNRLQGIYGGGGPGFIPIKQVYQQLSAKVTCSENWLRLAAFDPKTKKIDPQQYGTFTSLSRFTPVLDKPLDSIKTDSLPIVKATINVGVSNRTYQNFKTFTKVGLHYGNVVMPTAIKVFNDDVLLQHDSLAADGNYHEYKISLQTPPENLRIELSSKISPDFYGVTLDDPSGISLDNVAMRGASGTVFAKLDGLNFAQMTKKLSPKVFIFQYGGNTMPYLKDSIGARNYCRYILSNINWVRKKAPDATVLFIGPSDMTTSKDGVLFTYPLLPYLNEQLKATCLKNNIAYWDMFKAMGGENAMEYWVEQDMAASDYTHFTAKGTKVISELFFTALYLDVK